MVTMTPAVYTVALIPHYDGAGAVAVQHAVKTEI